jgi:hypothetical protein
VAQARRNALTPDELEADPRPAAPSNRKPERSKTEGSNALQGESEGVGQGSDDLTELERDALIPEAWQPDKIMAQFNADELENDDPRSQELVEKLKALWKGSPVVQDLDGKRVKVPGFVVPLDTDGQQTGEFLLVPLLWRLYPRATPPANQTVHVIKGTDRVSSSDNKGNPLAVAGISHRLWFSLSLFVAISATAVASTSWHIHPPKKESEADRPSTALGPFSDLKSVSKRLSLDTRGSGHPTTRSCNLTELVRTGGWRDGGVGDGFERIPDAKSG